jgi:hypothetical protein
MAVDEIIIIVENRLVTLRSARALAVAQGNLEYVTSLDAEIAETQNTLAALNTL